MDAFEFVLAENLGKTVKALRSEMGNDEYLAWQAFYEYRAEQVKLADKKAK